MVPKRDPDRRLEGTSHSSASHNLETGWHSDCYFCIRKFGLAFGGISRYGTGHSILCSVELPKRGEVGSTGNARQDHPVPDKAEKVSLAFTVREGSEI